MKALKIIGIIIVALIATVFIVIQFLSDEAHLSRSITIDAEQSEIYHELNTFRNFNSWSPWAEKDSATVYEYSGSAIGVGAKMNWASEMDDVGTGSMEIIETKEGELVKMAMKFGGFDSSPTASFIIEGSEEGTTLSWTYDEYEVSGLNRIFALMMDKFLGPDYEQGLKNFKERMESYPEFTTELSVVDVSSFDFIGITTSSSIELISSKMAQSYGSLMSFMGKNGIEMNGYPIAVYSSWTPEGTTFTCGIPVKPGDITLEGDIKKGTIESGLAIKSVYMGDYAGGEAPHNDIANYIDFVGYEMVSDPWEEYVTDPTIETDTSKWQTNVYYLVN